VLAPGSTGSIAPPHRGGKLPPSHSDRDIVRDVELGVGLAGDVLWVSGSPQAFVESQLDGATAGALIHAAYRKSLGPVDLAVGPELTYLLRPIIVQVSGTEVFRMPTLVAGLNFDASAF
jgi:hypothetical protein